MISRRSVLALAACTALGAVGCSKTEEYTGPVDFFNYSCIFHHPYLAIVYLFLSHSVTLILKKPTHARQILYHS